MRMGHSKAVIPWVIRNQDSQDGRKNIQIQTVKVTSNFLSPKLESKESI